MNKNERTPATRRRGPLGDISIMSIFDQIVFDDRDFDTEMYESVARRMSQEGRPHIFVRKLRERPHSHTVLSRRDNPSWNIDAAEFGSLYSASKFAAEFELLLDMHVTVDFGRMGKHEPEEVQDELSSFIRCYVQWCRDQKVASAWMYSVEMSRNYHYHAHVALHVPGVAPDGTLLRRKFRKWAKDYTKRRGEHIPRAIKVRGGSKPSELEHWIIFQYLVKGFEPKAVLCSARNSPDGLDIRLGDIIARWYRDPGPVRLNRRTSVSSNIGPSRRAFGAPTGRDHLLPQAPDLARLDIDRNEPLTREERMSPSPTIPVSTPYRSPFDDGIFDVRKLYSARFYEFVAKIPVAPLTQDAASSPEEESFDLTEHLRSIEI